jgi:hypothetical protein
MNTTKAINNNGLVDVGDVDSFVRFLQVPIGVGDTGQISEQ